MALPNLKLYRITWLASVVLALLAFFSLQPINTPPLTKEPASFDGQRALHDLRSVAQSYPKRVAGSDADKRAEQWLVDRIKELGLEAHFDTVVSSIEGRTTSFDNVWAVSKGQTDAVLLLVANRDSPPLATQGADNNASGVAALLELARVFSLQAHTLTIVFLWSDGDTYGAVGTKDFVQRHSDLDIRASIALTRVGLANADAIELNGWSATDMVAPPWLWALANSAGRAEAVAWKAAHPDQPLMRTPLPSFVTQCIRLAVPVGGGSQAPLVAAGIPALTLSAQGPASNAQLDTVSTTSASTLTKVGGSAERMVNAIDAAGGDLPRSGSAVFFSRNRAMPGIAVKLALLVLLVPLVVVTVDLLAATRRRRGRLGPAWLLYLLRLAPWLAMLVLVYAANLFSLLPHQPGAAFPPDSLTAHHPRYIRAFVLLAMLVAAALYAHAVERKLIRRAPVPAEATVTVVHIVLLAVAALALLINPFSLILVLPAAVLWPLARKGFWPVSRLPAWGGLVGLAGAFVYFAVHLGLGWSVWWYFFLLVENHTVPAGVALLGVAFVTAAIHLGHHLHRPRPSRNPKLRPAALAAQNAGSVPAEVQSDGLGRHHPQR